MNKISSFIRINAVAKYDRHDAMDDAKSIITSSGGWVTDYRLFSNRSICLLFEIEANDAAKLYPHIQNTKLTVTVDTEAALEELNDVLQTTKSNKDLKGSFQVTFVHDDPDLIIEVPPLEL